MRLLLVEDDRRLAEGLKEALKRHGFAVDWQDNGVDGEFYGAEEPYDAIILDLGLPGRPGLEVLRNWRRNGVTTPVIILTARDSWHERVAGLKEGADDYLGKPFHQPELLARLDALLRRSQGRPGQELQCDGLLLDEDRQQATVASGKVEALTGIEFRLLRYLMAHPGIILSKFRLTEHVYEGDSDRDSNVIEVYINRLRQKIGRDYIETRRGQGYIFTGNSNGHP